MEGRKVEHKFYFTGKDSTVSVCCVKLIPSVSNQLSVSVSNNTPSCSPTSQSETKNKQTKIETTTEEEGDQKNKKQKKKQGKKTRGPTSQTGVHVNDSTATRKNMQRFYQC